MSALDAIFVKGGQHWRPVPEVIALLPRGTQHAATVALECLLRIVARNKDELETLKPTDLDLAAESERMAREAAEKNGVDLDGSRGYGPDFIQKGLNALDVLLGKLGKRSEDDDGLALIKRKSGIGMHGRRVITILPVFAGKEKKEKPAADDPAAGPPPGPPPDPEKGGKGETTTHPAGSSSFFAPIVGTDPTGPTPPAPPTAPAIDPELLRRAKAILPRLNLGNVVDVILHHGADVMAEALDSAEQHNRTAARDGKKPVQTWGYFANAVAAIVRRKAAEHLVPELPPVPTAGPAPADLRKAQERAEAAAQAEAAARRDERLRAAWGLLDPAEAEAIRAAVRAENPAIARWPSMFEPLCLAELERRQQAEEPRAP